MRTTVDLPDDLHSVVVQRARDTHSTVSRTVADLVRAGLQPRSGTTQLEIDPETGFPLFRIGRPITLEEVQAFLDED